jgi:hypothetical protein
MKLQVLFALTFSGTVFAAFPRPSKRARAVQTTTTTTPCIGPSYLGPTDDPDEWVFPFPVAIGVHIVGISTRGRLMEQYDMNKVSRTYGNDVVSILREHHTLDERLDIFTPQTSSGEMKEITPFGELRLGSIVAQTGEGIIFNLPQVPELLIKYQANCLELSDNYADDDSVVHPLILDSAYGAQAGRHNVGMDVVFVSPPARMCPTATGKCAFAGLSEIQYEGCRQEGGSIRYILMKRSLGITLDTFRVAYGGSLPFNVAMNVGATTVELLQNLHLNASIIHGDIHENNIMVECMGNTTDYLALTLIDFGRANRVVRYPESTRLRGPVYSHFMHTQWQIDGHYWAPRDDVLKTIHMIARLVYDPEQYVLIEAGYERRGYDAQKQFKTRENVFAPTIPWDPTARLDIVDDLAIDDTNKERIRENLARILEMVRGLNSTNQPIPYESIRQAFLECSELSS